MKKIINGEEMFVETLVTADGRPEEIYFLVKLKFKGESNPMRFLKGKDYYGIKKQPDFGEDYYSVIDETGEDYVYHIGNFDIIKQ